MAAFAAFIDWDKQIGGVYEWKGIIRILREGWEKEKES